MLGVFMKKIILLLVLFVLFGCEKPVSSEIESISSSYQVSVSTFESFYFVETHTETTENHSIISLSLTPVTDYDETDVEITFGIYYHFIFEEKTLKGYIEETMIPSEVMVSFSKSFTYGSQYEVLGFVIIHANGEIKTDEIVTVVSKYYTEPFDKELTTYHQALLYLEFIDLYNQIDLDSKTHLAKTTSASTKITTSTYSHSYSQVTTEQLIKDPFFYKIEVNHDMGLNYEMIYRSYQDAFYLFFWDGFMHNNSKQVSKHMLDLDDPEIEEIISIHLDQIDYDFSFKNLTLSKENQSYVFKGLLKNILPEEDYETLKFLYHSMGISLQIIDLVQMTLSISFDPYLLMTTNFEIIDSNVDIKVEVEQREAFYFGSFDAIDPFMDPNYLFGHPTSFNDVTEPSDFLTRIDNGGIGNIHFYKGYLVKGVYHIDTFDGKLDYLIFDDQENTLEFGAQNPYINSDLIEIPHDGIFYIAIIRLDDSYPDYSFKLTKTDLIDLTLTPILLDPLESKPFIIESEIDIVRLQYEATQREIIILTIDSDQDIDLYYPYVHGQYLSSNQKTIMIGLTPQVYQFYLKGTGAATGHISIETFPLPDIYSPSTTTYEISESFFEDNIFYGGTLGSAYLKLEVDQEAIYQFEMTFSTIGILKKIGNDYHMIDSLIPNEEILLEIGTYYITVSSSELKQGNIRYQTELLIDDVTHITLNRFNYHENVINDLNRYQVTLFNTLHVHEYRFHLESNEYILFYGINTYLKNEHGEILNLFNSDPMMGYNNLEIYYLKAGTYTIIQTNFYDDLRNIELKIGIIDSLPLDDNLNHQPIKLTSLGNISLTKDHAYDNELIEIEILKSGTYQFLSNIQFEIYQDMDLLGSYRNHSVFLEAGTYYVMINTYLKNLSFITHFSFSKIA